MALTPFQAEVLRLLAPNRSPDSAFGGGATLNRDDVRQSQDLDIEHASADAVRRSFARDKDALIAAGYQVVETERSRPEHGYVEAVVRGERGFTHVDWTTDSAVRFYPLVEDEEFGWRLHDIDLAVNKILALAGRREPRDYHDVVTLHRGGLHLAILAWAACGKDPGLTPELVLDEITRNARFTAEEISEKLDVPDPVNIVTLKRDFLQAIAEARDLFPGLPRSQAGFLYVDGGDRVRLPDAGLVDSGELRLHPATVGGAWLSVPDQRRDRDPSA